ncbi:MAG: hypothetical protein HC821_05725 [Lewinella sp.]|nr:hypothetical protein [Lewinella sp.]
MLLRLIAVVFFAFGFIHSTHVWAQETAPLPLRVIVQRAGGPPPAQLGVKQRVLSTSQGIYLLNFSEVAQWKAAYVRLGQDPMVMAWQYDYQVDWRNAPNDEHYERQPNLTRLGFPMVWAASTGGVTSRGDSLVVAVLDGGFDLGHPDLRPNLWRNAAERPGDGIDNDQNGYIDDAHGWDFVDESPCWASTSTAPRCWAFSEPEATTPLALLAPVGLLGSWCSEFKKSATS